MRESNRNNTAKWAATAEWLLNPIQRLQVMADKYGISESTLSYALMYLQKPNEDIDIHHIKVPSNTAMYRELYRQGNLTPAFIADLFIDAKIPVPVILKQALNNNTETTSEIVSEEEPTTTPTTDNAVEVHTNPVLCTRCNTVLIPNASFCHNCGAPAPISKPKALTICNGLAEIIKFALPDKHKAMCLTWLERVKDYIEQTEE